MKFQLDSSKPRIFPNTSSPSTGWKFSSWVLSELKVNGTCPSMTMTTVFPRRILSLALTCADSRSISQIPRRDIGSGPDGGIVVARGVARERSNPLALMLLPVVLPPSESTPLAPFKLLGIDSDNGSEFINYHLKAFCDQRKIKFTRGRPYQKDDNAHIEQKNWTHVRKILGYLRYDSPIALEAINDLYQKEPGSDATIDASAQASEDREKRQHARSKTYLRVHVDPA